MEKRIVWTRYALNNLDSLHEYIFNTSKSLIIADRVADQILKSARTLAKQNQIYPLDKYKAPNDGSYRAYEIFHYRISYRVATNEILILSVRHTSMNPRIY